MARIALRWCLLVLLSSVLVANSGSFAIGQDLKEFNGDYLESPEHGPELSRVASAILSRTNELRKEHGRQPVTVNKKLTRAAQYFAAYMAAKGKFAHDADGNRPAERVSLYGYDYCLVAENIAYQSRSRGFRTEELAAAIFDSWKTSPPHLANILDPDITEVGVALGYDAKSGRYYAAQEFGRPKSAAIEFEITNRTMETVRYTVAGSAREKTAAQPFDLPPRTTMHHARCRPARLDWGWTKAEDNVAAKSGRAYVIAKSERGYDVREQAASE
jgi:uncharacterized protein YkwD